MPSAFAAVVAGAPGQVQLTVYSDGSALVSEERPARIPAKPTRLLLNELPPHIVADSLRLSAPGMTVLSERVVNHTRSAESLRHQAVGKTVMLYPKSQTSPQGGQQATLIAVDGGAPVVRLGDRVEVVDGTSPWRIVYPASLATALAGTSVTVQTKGPADGPVNLTYLTDGLSWHADYVATLNDKDNRLALQAFASLHNTSGADYSRARLSVVAGRLHRPPQPRAGGRLALMAPAKADNQAEPRKLFEYYVYRLPGTATLTNGSTVRVPLTAERSLAVTTEYRIQGEAIEPFAPAPGTAQPRHAQVILHGRNTTDQPLPAGDWRLYGAQGGAPALLGEDRLQSVPKGEAIALQAGRAFDITARRTELSHQRIDNRTRSARWRVSVHNAKPQAVQVRVVEPLPGDWTIEQESAPHQRVDASHAAWTLKVPAGGQTQLTYRVRWQ